MDFFSVLRVTGYRLPTEAEWEYAARAGTTGDRHGPLDDVAWYGDNCGSKTHRVGTKRANAWGLHDTMGNVWEWTQDWYGDYSGAAADPQGSASGVFRVIRGGAWGERPKFVTSAHRGVNGPAFRSNYMGFRPARSF
jgi:sulfatase modifying factor 1